MIKRISFNSISKKEIRDLDTIEQVVTNAGTPTQTETSDAQIIFAQTISTSNITLSGNQTINGYTTVEDDVIVVNAQTTAPENGIYRASAGAWTELDLDYNNIYRVKIVNGDFDNYEYAVVGTPLLDTDNISFESVNSLSGEFDKIVKSTNTLTDNRIIKADVGDRDVQESGVTLNDTNDITGIRDLSASRNITAGGQLIADSAIIGGFAIPNSDITYIAEITVTENDLLSLGAIPKVLIPAEADTLILPYLVAIEFVNVGTATGTDIAFELRDRLSTGAEFDIHPAFDTSDWLVTPPTLYFTPDLDAGINKTFGNSIRLNAVNGTFDLNLDGGELFITIFYKKVTTS